ncbi:hypothetical protein [Salibacterium halotolerans]|uniref:hypothetical protein n=1 Tax=Salibacterium halotolerans TaxID=1884432 RepID=UPI00147E8755|nr:hypothetical protein [Salibacterium halotolerans]
MPADINGHWLQAGESWCPRTLLPWILCMLPAGVVSTGNRTGLKRKQQQMPPDDSLF